MLEIIKKINSNEGMLKRRDIEQVLSQEILNAELELKELLSELKSYSGSNKDKAAKYEELTNSIRSALKEDKGLYLLCSSNGAKIAKCDIDLNSKYLSDLSLAQKITLERNLQAFESLESHLDSLYERSKTSVSIDLVEETVTMKNGGPVSAEWLLRSVEKDYETDKKENKFAYEEERIEIGQTLSDLRIKIIKLCEQEEASKKGGEKKPSQSPQTEIKKEMTHAEREEARRKAHSSKELKGGPTSCSTGGCLIM